MKITDLQKNFFGYQGTELLDRVLSSIVRLSEDHPDTQGKEVSEVEIKIIVSYEGTPTKTASNIILPI